MKDLKIINNEIREKLRAEFPKAAYKKHPTKTYLTTLKAAFIFERLNDVFGIGRWDFTHEIIISTSENVVLLGTLHILDYECKVPSQYGGHSTKETFKGYELSDIYKSAVTDSLSKCASYIEIGIDMFKGLVSGNGESSAPKRKSIFNENHAHWNKIKDRMIGGENITLETLEGYYTISQDDFTLLTEQVLEKLDPNKLTENK